MVISRTALHPGISAKIENQDASAGSVRSTRCRNAKRSGCFNTAASERSLTTARNQRHRPLRTLSGFVRAVRQNRPWLQRGPGQSIEGVETGRSCEAIERMRKRPERGPYLVHHHELSSEEVLLDWPNVIATGGSARTIPLQSSNDHGRCTSVLDH